MERPSNLIKKIRLFRKLPFDLSEEDYLELEKEWQKIPELEPLKTITGKKQQAKKGHNLNGEKVDSFWEYVAIEYYRRVKHQIVVRNTVDFLFYKDEKGKTKKWFYDLLINGQMYEVKGIFREKDMLKSQQHPEVNFIVGQDIDLMVRELDKLDKNWRDNFIGNEI